MSPVAQTVSQAANLLLDATLRKSFPTPKLKEVITVNNGQGLRAEDRDSAGHYEVFGSGGCVGVHSNPMHEGPFVVIGRKGSAGKVTFAQDGGWVTDTAYFATPLRPHELHCKFLFYALKTLDFRPDIITTAIPGINRTAIYSYSIPLPPRGLQQQIVAFLDAVAQGSTLPELPPPLAEQRRVVARIEELAAQIHEARTLRHQAAKEAEALAASWLNSAFEHFPSTCMKRLGDITEIIGGGSLPDTTLATDTTPEVFLMKVSDMNRPGNEVFVRSTASGLPANSPLLRGFRVLPVNSIVFPKRGGAIATNKKRILQRPAVLDPNTMGVFSKDNGQLTREFLFKWFGNLDLASMQEGTSVPQINKGDLAPLQIPVPPIPEQRRIVAELDALQAEVDALKHLQSETAVELEALLPAVLDKAFKGEL